MVYGCTRERVSIDGEYSGKIFDTDLSVVPGDLYTMALTRPRVTCRRYSMIENMSRATLERSAYFESVPSCWRNQSVISGIQNVLLISIGSEW